MSIKELTVGQSTDDEVKVVLQWAKDHVTRLHQECGWDIISFDVENVTIDKIAAETLKSRQDDLRAGNSVRPVKTYRKSIYGSGIQLPAKIILGDGLQFLLSIRFPFNQRFCSDGSEEMYFDTTRPALDLYPVIFTEADPIFEFICQFSGYVGVDITKDVVELEDFFFKFYGITKKLPRALELPALYTVNGGAFDRQSLAHLNYILLGGVMCKMTSQMDNAWTLTVDELSVAAKTYLIDDVRSGHCIALVLFTAFIRANFPDPDCCCYSLGLNQAKWLSYISNVIVYCVSGMKIQHPELIPQADTKNLLMLNLRQEPNSDTNQLTRLEHFERLLAPFPTIVYGGARVLHQVRSFWTEHQYQVFSLINMRSNIPVTLKRENLSPDLQAIDLSYLLFGRTLSINLFEV